MEPYRAKSKKLSGTNYKELMHQSMQIFRSIEKQTKRRPYIRSPYFRKDKIFFHYFWTHLKQKPPRERFRRLQYFAAAVELIAHSRNKPEVKPNPNRPKEMIYRFAGRTSDNYDFYIQIKESRGRKYFMSCFPKWKNSPPMWGAWTPGRKFFLFSI